MYSWQWSIFPGNRSPSIFDAGGGHGAVRHGKRWKSSALTTRKSVPGWYWDFNFASCFALRNFQSHQPG